MEGSSHLSLFEQFCQWAAAQPEGERFAFWLHLVNNALRCLDRQQEMDYLEYIGACAASAKLVLVAMESGHAEAARIFTSIHHELSASMGQGLYSFS